MSIIDNDLELRPDWERHVGPDIGGIEPASYGWNVLSAAREFYVKGSAYSDWLAAVHRPVLPNTGLLTLAFDLMTDSNTPLMAQALEFDTRVSVGGYNYNFSSQVNYAEGGMLQISDATGKWMDTGFKPGKFSPDLWYQIRMGYRFNLLSQRYSFATATIGIKSAVIPVNLQNLPAQLLKWADSVSLQVQLDLAGSGGGYSIFLKNVRYIWE